MQQPFRNERIKYCVGKIFTGQAYWNVIGKERVRGGIKDWKEGKVSILSDDSPDYVRVRKRKYDEGVVWFFILCESLCGNQDKKPMSTRVHAASSLLKVPYK